MPEPRTFIGPTPSYRTILYYRTTPIGSLLSDPHRPTELSDHNKHALLSDLTSTEAWFVIGLSLRDSQVDLSDLKDSFLLFLLSRNRYHTLYMNRGDKRERNETMLLDQAIKNASDTLGDVVFYSVIGISCVVGIAVFIGVVQVLSGPSTRCHIGH